LRSSKIVNNYFKKSSFNTEGAFFILSKHFHKEERKTEKKKKESLLSGRRIVGSRFLRYFLYLIKYYRTIKNIAKPAGLDLEATFVSLPNFAVFFVF
jgi:hypothetical protein